MRSAHDDSPLSRCPAALSDVEDEAFDHPERVRALQWTEEVHAFAEDFNWDDSTVAALVEVIRHPLCDAGTAKALYWLADPDDLFSDASTREEVRGRTRREHWDLLVEIEERLAAGRFASARIPFEPPHEPEEDVPGRAIPAVLFVRQG